MIFFDEPQTFSDGLRKMGMAKIENVYFWYRTSPDGECLEFEAWEASTEAQKEEFKNHWEKKSHAASTDMKGSYIYMLKPEIVDEFDVDELERKISDLEDDLAKLEAFKADTIEGEMKLEILKRLIHLPLSELEKLDS